MKYGKFLIYITAFFAFQAHGAASFDLTCNTTSFTGIVGNEIESYRTVPIRIKVEEFLERVDVDTAVRFFSGSYDGEVYVNKDYVYAEYENAVGRWLRLHKVGRMWQLEMSSVLSLLDSPLDSEMYITKGACLED